MGMKKHDKVNKLGYQKTWRDKNKKSIKEYNAKYRNLNFTIYKNYKI